MKRLLHPNILLAVVLIGSVVVNIALVFLMNKGPSVTNPSDDESLKYPLLSKRIFAENQNDILIHFVPLRAVLNDYITKQKEQIGLYFEYLPSGTSIGINDRMEVRFASLIKIPVVMAVYKQMEDHNFTKNNYLTIKEENLHKGFGNLWKRGAGARITVEEAIELSLKESDNTALRTLVDILPQGAIEAVFENLDIAIDTGLGYPIISPKNYASIMRSLYLSSYLSREHSHEILELLTQTKFDDMLTAGIDPSITVAHKIGVFDPLGVHSDCGIVYIPNRPYTICIMVEAEEKSAKQHIAVLSKMIFGYIIKIAK